MPQAEEQKIQCVSLHYTDPRRSTWPHQSKPYCTCRSSCILWWPDFQPLQQKDAVKRHEKTQTASKKKSHSCCGCDEMPGIMQMSFVLFLFCAKGVTVLFYFWLHHCESSSSVSSYPQISSQSSPCLVLPSWCTHNDMLLAVLLMY